MGRLHCLVNHIMHTMGSDIAPVQSGASMQLYHKALNTTFPFCAKINNHSPPYPQANKWRKYAINFMYTF